MSSERDIERRARDMRLAWTIVGVGGTVTLVLAAILVATLFRYAAHSIDDGMRQHDAEVAAAANIGRAPIPPDTARPLGRWSGWLTPANRPAAALARGEHGSVRVTLAIGADGRPTGCSVARSSGFDALDSGTCQAMMGAGRFAPVAPGEPGGAPGQVRRWTSPAIDWRASAQP